MLIYIYNNAKENLNYCGNSCFPQESINNYVLQVIIVSYRMHLSSLIVSIYRKVALFTVNPYCKC